ncbi:MAG: DUF7524 family protein [Methanoculleaceae archaeon]
MDLPEIHINRRGINTIDAPEGVVAHPGEDLVLRLVNHGGPLHLTITAENAFPFTTFDHEKVYLQEREEIRIPLRPSARRGTFNVMVIAGYGSSRKGIAVRVEKRPPPPPPPEAGEAAAAHEEERGEAPDPVGTAAAALMAAAILLYSIWSLEGGATVHIAFVTALAAFIAAWFRRRPS